jgi:hypothetical protein
MEIVPTRKLNKGTNYVFGNVTQEMLIAYVAVWIVLAWFSRAWLGNQLMQMAAPLPVIALVVHPITVAVSDLAIMQKAMLALQFAMKADRYVIRPDPMPLPAIIPNEAMKFKRTKRR